MEAALLAVLDLATLQSYRAEAIDALHKLATGQKTVKIGIGDRSAEYNNSTIGQLRGYLADLQNAIDAKGGGSGRRPIHLAL